MLVADSYDGARIPCVKYLTKLGFRVEEAVDGPEALDKMAAMPAHVSLVEHALPRTSIADLLARRSAGDRTMPLIVMTSDLGKVDERVTAMPFVTVLAKPFSLTMMVEEIRRLLRQQPPVGQ